MKESNTIEKVKAVAKAIVTIGTGCVVGNIVNCTTPGTTGKIMRLVGTVTGGVMAAFASDALGEYTDKKIDEMSEAMTSSMEEIDEDSEETAAT